MPHDIRRESRTAPRVLVLAVALAVLVAPASARASCLVSDEIGGIRISELGLQAHAPDIAAASGLLIGPGGRVLWARDASGRRAQASITKIMTALLVLERADLDEMVTVSAAASAVPYAIGLEPGERRSVRELLEFALVASSNDAAVALAEHVGGSVPGFVELMNDRAEELDLESTRFANPHGLDAAGHFSCAADVAALTAVVMQLPEYQRIVALPDVTLPVYGARTAAEKIESTDHLLGTYGGLVGGKTGFTDDADYCFVASAQRQQVPLTVVVLGAPSSATRFAETAELLDWGFEHLTYQTIASANETVDTVPVALNPARVVSLRFAETTAAAVFDLDGEIARELAVPDAVDLPMYEGQPLGEVELVQGDRLLATLPLVASADMASAEETVGAVPVSDYLDRTVVARASGEPIDVPEFDEGADIERTVLLDDAVSAPVSEGERIGVITYAADGEVIVEVPVVAAGSVEAPGVAQRVGIWFARAWRWVTGEPTMAQPVVAISAD